MIEITLWTDPACPFAYSAEPVRQRLRWHYGDGLRWQPRMIVLTREPGEAEKLAGGAPGLQKAHGMPIDPAPRARPASSEPACRAVVAARLHVPETEAALLRSLQVRSQAGALLDDPALMDAAARDAGLDPVQLRRWSEQEQVHAALQRDADEARAPTAAARALDHKLSGPPQQRRYSAPSVLLHHDGQTIAIPGFNPPEAYETAIANLDPGLPRRPPPADARDLLSWAGEPLATAEVAMVLGTTRGEAEAALGAVATRIPTGADAFWALG